jgi:hypothetical protein
MAPGDDASPYARGAEFEFADGTLEVVFETAEGRVLTVREYPSYGAFDRAIDDATYRGENEAVRTLPDIDAFDDG